MQGIPLVASSPVRHGETSPGGGGGGGGVGGGGINPVEVHAYAPTWKALTEFALHNDLERIDPSAPHFQQLINQVPSPPRLLPPSRPIPHVPINLQSNHPSRTLVKN
jgi:insulin gene enhancer protein ISL-1